jgi:predicted double-glycine peptidase
VLAHQGRSLFDEDAIEMCGTESPGTVVDLAVQGLADSGIDSEFRQFTDLQELRELVLEDQPVIAFLWHPAGESHAVVVCDVGSETVTVMDPALGDYIDLPTDQFETLWCDLENGGMIVGSARGRGSEQKTRP